MRLLWLVRFQLIGDETIEYLRMSILALTAYDWMLTLSREGQFFWTGKARPISAILYFSNKYLNLFTVAIATPLWQAPLSDQVCFRRVSMAEYS